MNLQEAIYSCLVAGSIGDALGAITESMNYWDIQKKYGRVEDFLEAPDNGYSDTKIGAITDDTTLKYVMCAAIIRKGGRIKPDDLAKIWIEELNLSRVSKTDQISCLKLRAGVNPWEAGVGNIVTCCPSMSIVPVGIINAGNPDQAYQDGYNIASISGDGFNLEAAALYCAGIAEAFQPEATWETVIDTMFRYSKYTMLKCVDLTMNLAQKSANIEEFRRLYYERYADWWSRPALHWDRNNYPNGTGAESIPLAMALIYLCKGDLRQAIIEAVNFGRDTDTIANFVGSMLGPVSDVRSLKSDWIQRVEDTSKFLYKEFPLRGVSDYTTLASAMEECLCNELKAAEERQRVLAKIIKQK